MSSIFPEKHYVVGPRAEGWQLVSLKVRKDEKEESHEHKGGILIHEPVPMDLCDGIKRTVTISLTDKSDKLTALYLTANGQHYIVPKEDYKALFIEIPVELIVTEKPQWQSEAMQEQSDKVWMTSLVKNNCLVAVKCHRLILSKNPLNISANGNKVEAVPKMAYFTYHLKPSAEYQFTQDAPASFFIVQCATA